MQMAINMKESSLEVRETVKANSFWQMEEANLKENGNKDNKIADTVLMHKDKGAKVNGKMG